MSTWLDATLIIRQVDVVSLVLHQQLSLWIRDLEEAMASPSDPAGASGDDFEESIAMYHRAQKLQSMGVGFGM